MSSKSIRSISWKWPEPPADISTISALEDLWGVHLPKDYVECATANHGGRPSLKCFDFDGRKEAVFNRLLPLTGGPIRVDTIWDAIKDRLPDRVFPFASDPFGNYLCFDFRERNPSVVVWDHEVASTDPHQAIQRICNSFSELLDKLYDPRDASRLSSGR